MAGLTEYITQKFTKMVGEITADLGRTADKLTNTENILRAVISGELELARVQPAEAGGFNILPPAPTLPVPEPAVNGAKEPEKAKTEKELVEAK